MASSHDTTAEEFAEQLAHPTPELVWSRAREVFGDEQKARSWMNTPRDIFDDRSPQSLIDNGNIADQRLVLQVLLRIDFGVFS